MGETLRRRGDRRALTQVVARSINQPAGPEPAGFHARSGRMASVSDLIDTTEMYVRTIFELAEEGVVPLRARIAERLEQSGPTVSQTVARLERDGLVRVSEDRHLELTDAGRELAERVMRKHRLAERMLVDLIGLEIEQVHEEACRWEHVMSDEVERRLLTILGGPTTSPFGNPIPALERLGAVAAVASIQVSLAEAVGSARMAFRIERLGEGIQMGRLVHQMSVVKALPVSDVMASRSGDAIVIESTGGTLTVSLDEAAFIFGVVRD